MTTWLRKRGHAKDDDHASNDTKGRSFAEVLAQLATQRGILENVKDDTGESEGPAEPAAPFVDEAVTRHGFNLHASLTITADDDLGRERLCRYGLRPPFSLSRFRVLRDGRISYRVKKSSRRVSRCRIMTPASFLARLCALVPPPRYPLTRFHGVLAPRAKLRPRIVPKLPGSATRACASAASPLPDPREPRSQAGERPPPRDKTGPIIPAAVPVSATTLARRLDGADVPLPNVLSARHLARIGGGLLYAASSNVPWATLLARTFDIDVKACARCAGRLEVRAVVTDHDIARKIRRCLPDRGARSAGRRHGHRLRAGVRVTDREPRASYVLRLMLGHRFGTFGHRFGRLPPARPPTAALLPPPRSPYALPFLTLLGLTPRRHRC